MGVDFGVVMAIVRKDLRQYLANPTGYVFLTLFILATAAAAPRSSCRRASRGAS